MCLIAACLGEYGGVGSDGCAEVNRVVECAGADDCGLLLDTPELVFDDVDASADCCCDFGGVGELAMGLPGIMLKRHPIAIVINKTVVLRMIFVFCFMRGCRRPDENSIE